MNIKELAHETVLSLFPERDLNTYKGDYGKILLLCGSKGYTGAPALAALGALRTGAGLVYLGVPSAIYEIEAVKLLEPIVISLPDEKGKLSSQSISEIEEILPNMDAVLVGCGLGRSTGVCSVVQYILENYSGPVVLDADGINAISEHMDIVRGRTSPVILTPHEGEFLRLGGVLTEDRVHDACALASDLGAVVVLKGHRTVITDGVDCYINPTGNPGMAVGGCGDVLAGMIVSLLGQGFSPMHSAACSAWLHGAAGDICANEIGQYGMLPSDMLRVLPRLIK